jgi:hypothetical protein
MINNQEIVPVQFINEEPKQQPMTNHSKTKVACKLKKGNIEITLFNGVDKYILYTILKELNAYDR